jgi:hypothetical protein
MVNTGPSLGSVGPLTRKVLDYEQTMKRLAPAVKASGDWTPLADLVAVDEFERVGTVLEVQNWQQYTQMLTQWSLATMRFETTLRRVCELPGLVYFEIEERHYRGDSVAVVNSLTVFEFNEAGKIRRLSVYLQQ